jgi:hypothetical protein
MSRFVNSETGVVVSVADDKDERFSPPLWEKAPTAKAAEKKSAGTTSK